MKDVTIHAAQAMNQAFGEGARATQEIGSVTNGSMKTVNIFADQAYNLANGKNAVAEQKIGVVN